jgi:hypothetical protein
MGGAQTDLAAGVLTFFSSTNSVSITNAGIAGTNVLYCPTSGFASNDLAIIHFWASDTYQLVVVTNVGTGNLGMSRQVPSWPPCRRARVSPPIEYSS